MSDFFKSKHKLTLTLGAFFLAVTLLAGSFAFLSNGRPAFATIRPETVPTAGLAPEDPEEDVAAAGETGDAGDSRVEPEESGLVEFRMPAEMRGVYLSPGADFITGSDTSEATLKTEIDKALNNAAEFTMNTVIVQTAYEDQVIYRTRNAPELSAGFDILDYIVKKAGERGLYTYVIFDASFYEEKKITSALAIGAGSINTLQVNLQEFVEAYPVDAVLIDGYTAPATADSYGMYARLGGGIGFANFMRQSPAAIVKTASDTVRAYAPGVQVGLLADAVWANSDEREEGSNTAAAATALGTGNADTKSFVEQGLVDFVAVKAYGTLTDSATPFEEVVAWWAGVARQSDVPLYVVHASDKLSSGEGGWTSADQLTKQVIALEEISGVRGSIFNSLDTLVADPQNAASTLVSYYNEEVTAEHVLTELQMTKPESTSYTTTENTVTFAGASDPGSPVTINGEAVSTDASGYFSVSKELKGGQNTFTVAHKDRTVQYAITRQVEILRDISPTGSIATDGSMSITISAWAYQDATVSAAINGSTVPMKVDESAVDESNRDSSYKYFVGQYTTPAAAGSEQSLGTIVVNASWNGETKSMTGASVKVNKKTQIEDGVPVVVVADQAKTYPYNTLDNVPSTDCYPLPKGAMDYAVGDEIVYKKDDKTYTYTLLASGMRVESKDIQAVSNDFPAGNAITGMEVTARDGYTYVTLKTDQQVSYSFHYASSAVTIEFHHTTQVPSSTALSSNPLFGRADWSGGNTLKLSLLQTNGFMGYKGYYDGSGNLVFRFNNPPASLSGARIAIDPGHGGSDPGTLGFLSSYPEKVINKAIAERLADELEGRGATVLLLDTAGGMELEARVARAEDFEADLLVSIHNNSAARASAQGTEVYYFYPYGKTFATSAASHVSKQLDTENRGAKSSYYHVTLSAQVPSILIECGFMSNQEEYEKLISDKYQKAVAVGIADAVSAGIKAVYTGSTASGTDAVGDAAGTTGPDASGGDSVVDVDLNLTSLTLAVGKTRALQATVVPATAANKGVSWSSGNTAVATVSSGGVVTAVKEGTAKITATTDDGGYKAVCTVTVTSAGETAAGDGVPVEDVSLDEDDISLDIGESYTLRARIYPSNAGDDTVTWKSGNTAVATVDAAGRVTGVKAGKTMITVTTADGGYQYSCQVTVTADSYAGNDADTTTTGVALSKVSFYDFDSVSVSLYVNSSVQLEVYSEEGEVIRPTDFEWKSSSNSVAKVNQYGVVTSKSTTGKAVITATPKDDSLEAIDCTVTVTKDKVAVTAISLNKSSLMVVQNQVNKELKATISPADATVQDITWTSKNTKIATVDSKGYITGKNRGTTTITATTKDGKLKATCEVEVLKATNDIDYVELDINQWEMEVGDEEMLYATVYPENARDTAVTWTTSNSRVATVDKDGTVKALAKGTVRIRATSVADPDCYDECVITIE